MEPPRLQKSSSRNGSPTSSSAARIDDVLMSYTSFHHQWNQAVEISGLCPTVDGEKVVATVEEVCLCYDDDPQRFRI